MLPGPRPWGKDTHCKPEGRPPPGFSPHSQPRDLGFLSGLCPGFLTRRMGSPTCRPEERGWAGLGWTAASGTVEGSLAFLSR